MTAVFIGIFLALVVGCVVLFCAVRVEMRRAEKAENAAAAYRRGLEEARLRAGRLQDTLARQQRVEEVSDEARKELARTEDSDLVSRANALFGVPDGAGK